MTPETVAAFRDFVRLRDFFGADEPEALASALAQVALWAHRQRERPGADHDALLTPAADFTAIQMGLLLHLATIDRAFFDLARRMAARTLKRHRPAQAIYLDMASALLVAGDGPRSRKPVLARDVAVVLAVAVWTDAGWHPTEALGWNAPHRSGCARVALALGADYQKIEKVWKDRDDRLADAGFSAEDRSAFFMMISPMKANTD